MTSQRDETTTADSEPSAPELPPTPMLLLLYSGGTPALEPTRLPIRSGTTVLGRAADEPNGLSLDDKRASRVHAILQNEERIGQLRVSDAGSRNGTFVNGTRITQAVLHDGDLLRIGDTMLLVRFAHLEQRDGPSGNLVGYSIAARRMRHSLARAAHSSVAVLLLGETGSGKEIAARYLHEQSGRSGPFVAINCSALPESLIESELFGHTRGAFTGALPHPGYFRSAQRGTLLLDEIGELSASAQPKLLRVLEERLVFPVGSVVGQAFDARLIFATNSNLLVAVSQGKFRSDLYARLAEVVITLPPLRARKEDIYTLLQHAMGDRRLSLSVSLAEALLLYRWPFNVREVFKLAAELSVTDDLAGIEARLRSAGEPPPTPPEAEIDREVPEREQLVELLRAHRGNVASIARTLRCQRKYIYRWIEQYALDLHTFRS